MNWENSRALTSLKREFIMAFFARDTLFYFTGGSALGTIREIIANKICTIIERSEVKDLVELSFP
ncbi:MAG: hypothetical protein WC340_13370 [Kiritimatiellia bacterium]